MFHEFAERAQHPFLFRLYLFRQLPAAWFSGIRVNYADEEKCVVTVPYNWRTKNPFRSTYFACLAMAAEMSTGVLAMGHCFKKDPPVSMLVRKIEANFFKKARGFISFTCEDGLRISAMVKEAIAAGKETSLNTYATGKNKDGDTVAEFTITWSFKQKAPKRR